MKKNKLAFSALLLAMGVGMGSGAYAADNAAPTLTPEEFEQAKTMYFQRCAGCHYSVRD